MVLTAGMLHVGVPALLLCLAPTALFGGAAPSHDLDLPATPPLVPPATEWPLNDCSRVRQIGPKPFYAAAQGPYLWLQDEYLQRLRQVGLLDRVIPGHINYSYIKYFLPEEREKLAPDAPMRRMVESFLDKGWPIHTIFYHRFQGNPPPTDALLEIFGDQWIGDGQPETVYRLEPVFHYLKTGERWVGSSMYLWDPEIAVKFFGEELIPRLEKELPFVRDLEHKWTRPELRRLSDLYCEEFYRPIGRCMPWGMYVGAYHMAGLPGIIAVGEKGADADWEAWFPPEVRGAKPSETVYLVDLEPTAVAPGWMPAGKEWAELNGDVKLITSYAWKGRVYPRSLYAQATSSFTYALGGEYRLFAAAAGVGTAREDTSVEFVVSVDGKEVYRSPVYRAGEPVLPVAVDVTGANELTLSVTDGGDGIRNDYAWWGEARLIRR